MPNTSAITCRLDEVDIIAALIKICGSLYENFTVEQQEQMRDDILRQLESGQHFLFVLLEPPGVKVFSEFHVFINGSDEQKQIKQLLNKKLPIILAVSVFDEHAEPRGDISVVGYSRLLDRVSSMTALEHQDQQRLLKYIKSRRTAWRLSYKAVTIDAFIDVLRKENKN